jgi:hypothetical protein
MRRSPLLATAVVCIAVGGCGGGDERPAPPKLPAESSWVPGQGSLALSHAYLAIATRAEEQGERRLADHLRRIELIDARKKAAREKARQDALRRYREQRRRALEKYRKALAKAEAERRKRERELARQRAEARRKWQALLRKLAVAKGKECDIPEVQREFDCLSGRQPLPKGARPPG